MALQNICGFSSPQLAAAANGAAPTFAFATTNTNYFALQGRFTSIIGEGACTFPTSSAYTPLIVGGDLTRTCNVLTGSSTYTDIACPTAINNRFSAGTYQLSFAGNGAPFISSDFVVALPTTSIVLATATQTVLVTATATVDTSGHVITPSVLLSVASPTLDITSSPSSSSMAAPSPPAVSTMPSIGLPNVPSIVVTSLFAASTSTTQTSILSVASSQLTSSSIRSLSSSSSKSPSSLSPTRTASLSSSTKASSLLSFTKISSSSSSTRVSTSAVTGETSSISSTKTSSAKAISSSTTKTTGSSSKISSAPSNKLPSSSSSRLSTLSTVITRISSSASPTPTLRVSPDATCGGKTGFTCRGSKFGDCCSQYGYCGSSAGYCDAGCNALAGTCRSQSVPSNVPSTPSLKISKDAKCGGKTGQTCKGSAFGFCCSKNGWCGSSSDYCGNGCMSGFGDCKTPRIAVRADPSGAGPDYTYPPIPTSTVYVATATVIVTVATITVTVTPGVEPAIPTSIDTLSLASANQTPISSAASLSSFEAIPTPSTSTDSDTSSSTISVCPTPTLAPGPFSTVVPKNFCLKVLTPCVISTDWLIKQGPLIQSNGPFFIDPTVGGNFTNIMRFEIREDKQLLVTTPGQAANTVARFSGGTAGMFRYSPEVSFLNNVTCTVRIDVPDYLGHQILKCTGVNQRRTYTDFRHSKFWDGDTRLYSTSDYVADPPDLPNDFRIELGLYTGDTCPEDPPIASSSATEASLTPSASTSGEPSTLVVSASDIISTLSATAVDAIATTLAMDAVSTTLAPSSSDSSTTASSSISVCPTPTLAPGPYDTVVPRDFCLKVLTPCVSSSGWLVKQTAVETNNGNFQLDPATGGMVGYVARFSIANPTGQMFITTPGLKGYKVAGYSTGTGGMFRWRDESANLNNVTCIVKTDVPKYEGYQVLKCSGISRNRMLTEFRHTNFLEGLTHLFGSNDDITNIPKDFRIELGVFTGGDCPDGPAFSLAPGPPSSTSEDLSTLDIPTPTPAPELSSSTSDILSDVKIPTISPVAASPSSPASSTNSPSSSIPPA